LYKINEYNLFKYNGIYEKLNNSVNDKNSRTTLYYMNETDKQSSPSISTTYYNFF
jgi:hypothetical protein